MSVCLAAVRLYTEVPYLPWVWYDKGANLTPVTLKVCSRKRKRDNDAMGSELLVDKPHGQGSEAPLS